MYTLLMRGPFLQLSTPALLFFPVLCRCYRVHPHIADTVSGLMHLQNLIVFAVQVLGCIVHTADIVLSLLHGPF